MGTRIRIGVAINDHDFIWTGGHAVGGADAAEQAKTLVSHYTEAVDAVWLASQPYLRAGVMPREDVVRWHGEWAAHVYREAVDNDEEDFGAYIAERITEMPSRVIWQSEWLHVDNCPSDVETVFIWRDSQWYFADVRGIANAEQGVPEPRPVAELFESVAAAG